MTEQIQEKEIFVPWGLKIVAEKKLSLWEMCVFGLIFTYTEQDKPCLASAATIADCFNMRKNTVRACLKSLTKKGMIRSLKVDGKIYRYSTLDEQAKKEFREIPDEFGETPEP